MAARVCLLALAILAALALPAAFADEGQQPQMPAAAGIPAANAADAAMGAAAMSAPAPLVAGPEETQLEAGGPSSALAASDLAAKTCKYGKNKKGKCRKKPVLAGSKAGAKAGTGNAATHTAVGKSVVGAPGAAQPAQPQHAAQSQVRLAHSPLRLGIMCSPKRAAPAKL